MLPETSPKSAENPSGRLSREDWIDAAWDALSEGSIDTIKVDRLSKRLQVTRGSFYWHFKNREELIDAVVDRWLHRLGRTTAVHHLLDAAKPPQDRLWDVFDYVVRAVAGPQSVFLRIAMQDHPNLLSRITTEDENRVQGYATLFRDMGLGADEAQSMAEVYYILVMSEFLRNGALPLDARLTKARALHDGFVAAITRPAPRR